MKRTAFIWFVGLIFFAILSVLAWWTVQIIQDDRKVPSEAMVGNKAYSLKALKEKGLPFSFLVLGDIHSTWRSDPLLRLALKEEGDISFMVLLGDFVNGPGIWDHRFFRARMAGEIRPQFPVFLVAGNHDIQYGPSIKKTNENGVTPEIYESLYGPRNLSFVFNGCLFVICGVDPGSPHRYLEFLRQTLQREAAGKRLIFLFAHTPPKVAVHIGGSILLPREEEFYSLLEEFNVTNCFFGDRHAYWRGQRKGTGLVISGGGGRFKSDQPEWGRFRHLIRVTVEKDMVDEDILVAGEGLGLRIAFQHFAFTQLGPALGGRTWVFYGSFFLFAAAAFFFLIGYIRSLRRWRGGR